MEQYISEQQEEEQEQSRSPSRRKRSNNKKKQDKKFICSCGKRYIRQSTWKDHYKTSEIHQNDTQQQRTVLKQRMRQINNTLNQKLDEDQTIKISDIPTFKEQSDLKQKADKIRSEICVAWNILKPTLLQGNIQGVVYNFFKDVTKGQINNFEDITPLRKVMLNQKVTHFVNIYELGYLENAVRDLKEFNDRILTETAVRNRRTVINFSWILLRFFRPKFAAKLQIILYTICHQYYNGFNINECPRINRFKQAQWSKYTFIERFLQDYFQFWIENIVGNVE